MGKGVRKDWFIILIGFLLLLNVGFVLGANVLENAFGGIGNIDLGATYMKFPQLIDGIIYIVFFIALCKTIMGKTEMFKGNNTVPVIIGIAFAISMMVWGNSMSPKFLLLKSIGPFVLIIAAAVAGVFIYTMIKDMTKANMLAAGIAIIVVLILLNFASSPSITGRTAPKFLNTAKQYLTLASFIVLPIGIGQQWRQWGFNKSIHGSPTLSERRDERTFFPKQTEAIEKIEGIEKGLEKNIRNDPGEKDIIQEEEGLERFDEYENVLNAEAAKFSTQLQELKTNEWNGEQKEAGMLTALSSYGNNINTTLSKMNSIETIDQAGKQYIAQNIQGIANVCSQIVENQKQIELKRKDTFGNLLTEDVKKIDDVIKKFQLISTSLSNLDKKITKDIGDSLVKQVEDKVKAQEKKLKLLQAKLNSDKFREEQKQVTAMLIPKIQAELDSMNNELNSIKSAKENIKNLTNTLYGQLKEVNNILNNMNAARKKLDTQTNINLGFLTKFDKSIENMTAASEKLKGDMAKIGQEAEIAEEVPEKAIEGVADIFNTMIDNRPGRLGIQPMMKQFYVEDVIPSIDDMKSIIIQNNVLDKLISPIQTSITQIDSAYKQLREAALKVLEKVDEDANNSKNISQAIMYVNTLVRSEQALRSQVTNNVMNTLDKVKSGIQTEVGNIDAEIQKLQNSEKNTLEQLAKALKIITDHKSRVNDKFKDKANALNQNMAQATQKITESRKAA